MAKVPPVKKRKGKGQAPQMEETKNNLTKYASNDKVQINFQVSPELKKEIQMYALENDMSLTAVLIEGFEKLKK